MTTITFIPMDLSPEEAKVLAHASAGGHYLMCQCAWCATQQRWGDIQHERICKRKPTTSPEGWAFTSACVPHADIRCHCDCGRDIRR